MIFIQYPSILAIRCVIYDFVRATVDNLKYMHTDQIVSTYWVSSAQCIPNSQYIVTWYRMMQNVRHYSYNNYDENSNFVVP